MLIILIIVLLLVFGGGGGYYGYSRWGRGGGAGFGLGTIRDAALNFRGRQLAFLPLFTVPIGG